MTEPHDSSELAGLTETRLLWLFLVFAIPGMIILAFWLNGYLGM